jgi:hypothetical protein
VILIGALSKGLRLPLLREFGRLRHKAAMGKEATDKAHSPDHDASLAKKVTEYILDNQDDTAQRRSAGAPQ